MPTLGKSDSVRTSIIVTTGLMTTVFMACSDESAEPRPTRPVADAGPNRRVQLGDRIEVLGRGVGLGSSAPLLFQWSIFAAPNESQAVLENPTFPRTSFTIDAEGDYILQLVVREGQNESLPDYIIITTSELLGTKPIANAGLDQTVEVETQVFLDGSASRDPRSAPLTYRWSFFFRPFQSEATLSDTASITPSFVPDVEGVYEIDLVVDNGNESATDRVVVRTTDLSPAVIVNAGLDQSVRQGDLVQLRGSADSEFAFFFEYQWTLTRRPEGSQAELTTPTNRQATFTADLPGTYEATLMVTDDFGQSASDTVEITALLLPEGEGRLLDLLSHDLVVDPTRGLLYASVPVQSPISGTGGSVVAIDPTTAEIQQALFVGNDPTHLAMSDNGQFLYVTLRGEQAIRRVDLATFTSTFSFAITPQSSGIQRDGGPIVVLPGQPNVIAVSTQRTGASQNHTGVVVFDAGVPRPTETPATAHISQLVGGPGNTIYGYNSLRSGFELYALTVEATGISVTSEWPGFINGFSTRILYFDGWILATNGQVIDTNGPIDLGGYAAEGPVAADPTRVYFMTGDRFDPDLLLVAFDRTTFEPTGDHPMSALFTDSFDATPVELVRWGERGLAFRTRDRFENESGGKLYILESALVIP